MNGEGLVSREATAALRARSRERLEEGFDRHVAAVIAQHLWDTRDEMINLVPFVDCARRPGLDPATVIVPRVADAPGWLRDLFPVFVRREDAALETFGWRVVATEEGPRYRRGTS